MQSKVQQPILLIDSLNVFTRHYTANPTMASTGEHMGGLVGFLYTLKALVERTNCKQVIVVWEGGGSLRRRQLFKEYKAHRKAQRLNRFYGDDMPNTVENRDDQVRSIVRCLKHVPVCQVYVSDCEADDIIGYYCKTRFKNENTIIVSSDKDYYQLLDDTTRIFRPGKKIFVSRDDVVREFGVSPRNFPLAKALCGDSSDNIPGVKGVGFKTVAKRFPALASDDEFDLEMLMTECQTRSASSKVKVFQSILDSRDLVVRNLKLVELDGSMLAPDQMRKADYVVDTFEPVKNKIDLIRELVGLGLGEFNADSFFYTMASL